MIKEGSLTISSTVLNKIVWGAESLSVFPIVHGSLLTSQDLRMFLFRYPESTRSLPLVTIIQKLKLLFENFCFILLD